MLGSVTVGGSTVPVGSVVTAEIVGAVNPLASNTIDSNGRYGVTQTFRFPADNLDTSAKDGGANGDTVILKVDGIQAGSTTFQVSGGPTTVNLDIAAPGGIVSIAVTPSAGTAAVGGTRQFTATGTFSNGSTSNVTASVTWSSSDTGIATMNAVGLATGIAAGTATVTATDPATGVSTAATFTVTTVPAPTPTPTAAPTGGGGGGRWWRGRRRRRWNSSDPNARTTLSRGNPTRGDPCSGRDPPVHGYRVILQRHIGGYNSERPWVSSSPSVAIINAAGLVTGVAEGTATIAATDPTSGLSSSTTLTVVAAEALQSTEQTVTVDTTITASTAEVNAASEAASAALGAGVAITQATIEISSTTQGLAVDIPATGVTGVRRSPAI